jgi:hypothetical protein
MLKETNVKGRIKDGDAATSLQRAGSSGKSKLLMMIKYIYRYS